MWACDSKRRVFQPDNSLGASFALSRQQLRQILAGAEARQHRGEIVRANVKVLADPSPQHGRGDVAAASFLLRLVQHPEDHALLAGESVTDVGQEVADVFQSNLGLTA